MLIGFKVRNFRSFRDGQTYSFVPSSDGAHASTHCLDTDLKAVPRLLRCAIIFGANGAGKTNFINALSVMREFVLRSTIATDVQYAEWYTPFRFLPRENSSMDDVLTIVNQPLYLFVCYNVGKNVSLQILMGRLNVPYD